ncbi:MAG TPA: phosphate ABC transporter permease subunit PstC [Acidimicrobiia bacterium]|jgi:phosphate transport system permease protein|nr:phosphate ABC transporter permease subunit PstC [Acidimicrobiia bacterium]
MVAASPPVSHLADGQRAPGLLADRAFRAVALLAGLSVLVILGLIAFSTTQQAWPAFTHQGLSYFTATTWDPPHNRFGTLTFLYGTIVVSAIALVFAVPVSIGIALFITEIAPRRLRNSIVYVIDLLASVPSVVFGLWGFLYVAPKLTGLYTDVSHWTHSIPLIGTMFSGRPITGLGFMTAGLVVALMITPIITSITREVFATVPVAQKEGATALGATRWEMIRGAVLPHSRSGIVGAVLIGLGRAMGETIAVTLVIGSATSLTGRLFSPGNTMAAGIASQFGEATGDYRAALVGLGVVLFFLTILIGVAARGLVARFEQRSTGA